MPVEARQTRAEFSPHTRRQTPSSLDELFTAIPHRHVCGISRDGDPMRTPPNGTICPTCDTCGDHLPHRPGSPRRPEGLHLEDPPPSPDDTAPELRLRRVFHIDVRLCERCGGTARIIACIENPELIRRILSHLSARDFAPGAIQDESGVSLAEPLRPRFAVCRRPRTAELLRHLPPLCDTLPCTLRRRRHGAREQLRYGGSSFCFSRWRACRRTSWSASSAPTGAPRNRAGVLPLCRSACGHGLWPM